MTFDDPKDELLATPGLRVVECLHFEGKVQRTTFLLTSSLKKAQMCVGLQERLRKRNPDYFVEYVIELVGMSEVHEWENTTQGHYYLQLLRGI